ncbi:ATP synthase subunit delta [Loa loa]|uniref:F-ATPase delta subunit n=2 Tax=Loa loa TaxID=7209 RepID=A0A1S0U3D1_LOALO|nr:ATP synthase subunit delta [Loa loa]EFO24487.2 ATP synthase subunit delta [Loa loa]
MLVLILFSNSICSLFRGGVNNERREGSYNGILRFLLATLRKVKDFQMTGGYGRMLSGRNIKGLSNILRRCYAAAVETAQNATKEASVANIDELRLTFASPIEVFFNNAVVKQVDISTLNGSIGILPKHVPVLGMLKPGVVRVVDKDDKSVQYFASSGTLSMNPDGSCQVLAEEAIRLEDIDLAKAEEELSSAQRRALEPMEDDARAVVQIEIETYEALVKAAHNIEK